MSSHIDAELSFISQMKAIMQLPEIILPSHYRVAEMLHNAGMSCGTWRDGIVFENWVVAAMLLWFNSGSSYSGLELVEFVQKMSPDDKASAS